MHHYADLFLVFCRVGPRYVSRYCREHSRLQHRQRKKKFRLFYFLLSFSLFVYLNYYVLNYDSLVAIADTDATDETVRDETTLLQN